MKRNFSTLSIAVITIVAICFLSTFALGNNSLVTYEETASMTSSNSEETIEVTVDDSQWRAFEKKQMEIFNESVEFSEANSDTNPSEFRRSSDVDKKILPFDPPFATEINSAQLESLMSHERSSALTSGQSENYEAWFIPGDYDLDYDEFEFDCIVVQNKLTDKIKKYIPGLGYTNLLEFGFVTSDSLYWISRCNPSMDSYSIIAVEDDIMKNYYGDDFHFDSEQQNMYYIQHKPHFSPEGACEYVKKNEEVIYEVPSNKIVEMNMAISSDSSSIAVVLVDEEGYLVNENATRELVILDSTKSSNNVLSATKWLGDTNGILEYQGNGEVTVRSIESSFVAPYWVAPDDLVVANENVVAGSGRTKNSNELPASTPEPSEPSYLPSPTPNLEGVQNKTSVAPSAAPMPSFLPEQR